MSRTTKLLLIGLGLSAIAVVIFFFTSLGTQKPSNQPTQLDNLAGKNTIGKKELLQYLPIKTDEFDIEYLGTDQTILVTLKKAPVEQSRKDSEKWFVDRGVTDFAKYNIAWIVTPD